LHDAQHTECGRQLVGEPDVGGDLVAAERRHPLAAQPNRGAEGNGSFEVVEGERDADAAQPAVKEDQAAGAAYAVAAGRSVGRVGDAAPQAVHVEGHRG